MKGFNFVIVPSVSNGAPVDPQVRARVLTVVVDTLVKAFGGATLTDGQGAWVDAAGVLVTERVTRVDAFGPDDTSVRAALATYIKRELSQDCVMVGFVLCTVDFV